MKGREVLLVLLVLTFLPVQWRGTAATSTTFSNRNPVFEFRAKGADSDGNTIDISSQGGDLNYLGKRIHFVPWYSLYWSSFRQWLIFVVNVTQSDFYMAYIYLDNATSNPFGFYLFHYVDGSFGYHGGFAGEQFVGSVTVLSPAVEIPPLSIQSAAKYQNKLFASGEGLEILSNEGKFGSRQIYALLNLYNVTGSNGWNELWTLETDGSNYYYGIFYMFNSDHTRVQYDYELRLNDLTRAQGASIPATWYLASQITTPVGLVTVVSNSTVYSLVFERSLLNFTVSGPSGSYGFFNATIPKALLLGQPVVFIDGMQQSASVTDDVDFWYIHMTYPHSEHCVTIGGSDTVPEFPSAAVLLAVLMLALVAIRRRSVSEL